MSTPNQVFLFTPPFTQLNTPYPATAYIKGFLNTKDISSFQMDLGIEVILEIFSKNGLTKLFDFAEDNDRMISENSFRIFSLRKEYIKKIDAIIGFLQGHNPSLARQICTEGFLPRASRFDQTEEMQWAFGAMGFQDEAKHLATLFLEDLSDFIKEAIDDKFGFSRYAERLGRSANSFDELYEHLQKGPSYIDEITISILEAQIKIQNPKLVCISVPFPGNLYSAFRCAKFLKAKFPEIKIAMGGGFANTELRSVSDKRVFEYFDFISLDDGELPLEMIVSNVFDPSPKNPNYNFYKRTFLLQHGEIEYNNFSLRKDYDQAEVGTPDYSNLKLDKYISVIEIANPMHSLWSDGRWNKLTMAHGCYWGKCTFCDISLDYIKLYQPVKAKQIVDRMEAMIAQTGDTGFHFVDEAAPPALMKELAIEILRRDLIVSWWTNIRFEKSFTRDLCLLLKASGCIAVSGGLEVASDRLLALIQKGVTVSQVAQVCQNFTEADIMVHSYLMYGYPTQTIQETVDSLEMVRQLFEAGVIQSGFWHQFALTAHSPVGLNPDAYGILPKQNKISFANNDIAFEDSTGIDHDQFSHGLKKSLYNYMHGICFEYTLQDWFDFEIPETGVAPEFIFSILEKPGEFIPKLSNKVLWFASKPEIIDSQTPDICSVSINTKSTSLIINIQASQAQWLLDTADSLLDLSKEMQSIQDLKDTYENQCTDFLIFWNSPEIAELKRIGVLVQV